MMFRVSERSFFKATIPPQNTSRRLLVNGIDRQVWRGGAKVFGAAFVFSDRCAIMEITVYGIDTPATHGIFLFLALGGCFCLVDAPLRGRAEWAFGPSTLPRKSITLPGMERNGD